MSEEGGMENGSDWKKFLRKRWSIVAIFVVAAILAIIGAIIVFLWFVKGAQPNLVPPFLLSWTMGHVVTFILHLIFWEFVIIGIPVIIAAVAGWLWWRRLPAEEKIIFGRGSRTSQGSGGVSLFLFIAFAIKVYIDGKWNVPISTFSLNYVVASMITILVWMAVIIGIPAAIGIVWWIHHEMSEKP